MSQKQLTESNNNRSPSSDRKNSASKLINNKDINDSPNLLKTSSRISDKATDDNKNNNNTTTPSSPSSFSSSPSGLIQTPPTRSSLEKRKSTKTKTTRVQSSDNLNQSDKKEAKKVGDFLIFINSKLGSGSYATVFEGIHQGTNRKVAIKVIERGKLNSSTYYKYLQSEIKIMKDLDSDYCIRMIDYLETSHNIYIVLEYCGGGDLNNLMKKNSPLVFDKKGRMKERFLKNVIYQLSEGLYYLHNKKIMHRDLKPANVLFSKPMEIIKFGDGEDDYNIDFGNLKIADLGLAKELDTSKLAQTFCGTPLFMAPEVMFNMNGKVLGYDEKADLWSIGVIIYNLCYGQLPFVGGNIGQILSNMKAGASFPTENTSSDLIDLLKGLFQYDPIDRFTFNQFYTHPYIANIRNELQENRKDDIAQLTLEDEYDIVDPSEILNMPTTPIIDNATDIPTTPTTYDSTSSTMSTSTQQDQLITNNNSIILFDEKVENNPDILTCKNYSIQTSLNLYPIIIFDFSELASSEKDRITLDHAELNLKICWIIAEMALNFEKSLKFTESFALYLRATQLIQNSTPHLSQLPTSQRKTALSTFMDHLLMDLFNRMEKVHSQIKHLNPSKCKDVTNIMYLSAIEITKEACCWEMIGYSKWTALYNRAFYLLSYLSELTRDNVEDHKKICHLTKIIQSKLNK